MRRTSSNEPSAVSAVASQERAVALRNLIDVFFEKFPNPQLERRVRKGLRLLQACEELRDGAIEGWAAGLVYAIANWGQIPCGVPGISRADFEGFFHVTMGTARKRAARVLDLLSLD